MFFWESAVNQRQWRQLCMIEVWVVNWGTGAVKENMEELSFSHWHSVNIWMYNVIYIYYKYSHLLIMYSRYRWKWWGSYRCGWKGISKGLNSSRERRWQLAPRLCFVLFYCSFSLFGWIPQGPFVSLRFFLINATFFVHILQPQDLFLKYPLKLSGAKQ